MKISSKIVILVGLSLGAISGYYLYDSRMRQSSTHPSVKVLAPRFFSTSFLLESASQALPYSLELTNYDSSQQLRSLLESSKYHILMIPSFFSLPPKLQLANLNRSFWQDKVSVHFRNVSTKDEAQKMIPFIWAYQSWMARKQVADKFSSLNDASALWAKLKRDDGTLAFLPFAESIMANASTFWSEKELSKEMPGFQLNFSLSQPQIGPEIHLVQILHPTRQAWRDHGFSDLDPSSKVPNLWIGYLGVIDSGDLELRQEAEKALILLERKLQQDWLQNVPFASCLDEMTVEAPQKAAHIRNLELHKVQIFDFPIFSPEKLAPFQEKIDTQKNKVSSEEENLEAEKESS